MSRRAAWWRLWYVWVIPAVLVVLNVVWLTSLRGVVLGRGSLLARGVEQAEAEVARLEGKQRELVEAQAALDRLRTDLTALRAEQLGPMRERLVPFLTEVVHQAHEANLAPEQIGYSYRRDDKSGLVHFAAVFALKGTYAQVRRCVIALERSPQFIVIEHIGLSGGADAASLDVGLRLAVATYFSNADEKMLGELRAQPETAAAPGPAAAETPAPVPTEVGSGE